MCFQIKFLKNLRVTSKIYYWAPKKPWTSKREIFHYMAGNQCQLLTERIQACQPVRNTWPAHRVQVPWPEDSAPKGSISIARQPSRQNGLLMQKGSCDPGLSVPEHHVYCSSKRKGKRGSPYFSEWGTDHVYKERRNLWQPFWRISTMATLTLW